MNFGPRKSNLHPLFFIALLLYKIYTVLPPNSRFLGLGIFREFEIRELKFTIFLPIHYRITVNLERFILQFRELEVI